jgi:hypothetical protein
VPSREGDDFYTLDGTGDLTVLRPGEPGSEADDLADLPEASD